MTGTTNIGSNQKAMTANGLYVCTALMTSNSGSLAAAGRASSQAFRCSPASTPTVR
jgi:hypothetical protein